MPGEGLRRTTSIRRRLSGNLLALIVLLSGAILLTTFHTAERVRDESSRILLGRAIARAERDVLGYLEPVRRVLLLSREWAAAGLIDPDDTDALDRLFVPVLEQLPQVSSVNFADAEGRGFLLLRDGDAYRNRRVHVDAWGPRHEYAHFTKEGLIRKWTVDEPPEGERYDPRTRAWYRVAYEDAARIEPDAPIPERVYWTEPYTFFTSGAPGITAAIHLQDGKGRHFVLAVDVLLSDLSDFTRHMAISPSGFAIILDERRRVIGLPGVPRYDDPVERQKGLLKTARELGVQAIADGAAVYQQLDPERLDVISFESGGETYWADVEPVEIGANRRLQIVVAVPERDLLGVVQQQRLFVAGATVLAVLAGSLIVLVLSRRFSEPLAALVDKSQRIGRLDLGESPPILSAITEVDQLAQEQERMRIALDAFSRYVPVELVRELLRRGEAARVGGSERELTILFSDIVGFTTIAESMAPPQLTAHMSEYFAALLAIIQEDGFGDVNEIAGDGIVAFWGAPADDSNHSIHAVDAVLRCCDALDRLNPEWRSRGLPELPTCFGLSSGPVVVGNVGAPSRMTYAAVGDTVNTASRVEGLNRIYGTRALATEVVRREAGRGYAWRLVDRVRVKGKNEAIEIHELLGRSGAVTAEIETFAARYEEALEDFSGRRFERTETLLTGLDARFAADASVVRLLERTRGLRAAPPPSDWEAVSVFVVK